jgi:hypothetical protein
VLGVKVKSIIIFMLSLLLIGGLLQIDAIGNLNPIFHSIAISIRRAVSWALDVHPPKTQQIILTGKQELLDFDSSQGSTSLSVTKPVTPQSQAAEGRWNKKKKPMEANTSDFLKGDFNYNSQDTSSNSAASQRLLLLWEMGTPEDPVTELFPETEWYDEINIENYDWGNLLEAEEAAGEIDPDEPIPSEVVAPLLGDLKTRIQQKLESNLSENTPKK